MDIHSDVCEHHNFTSVKLQLASKYMYYAPQKTLYTHINLVY